MEQPHHNTCSGCFIAEKITCGEGARYLVTSFYFCNVNHHLLCFSTSRVRIKPISWCCVSNVNKITQFVSTNFVSMKIFRISQNRQSKIVVNLATAHFRLRIIHLWQRWRHHISDVDKEMSSWQIIRGDCTTSNHNAQDSTCWFLKVQSHPNKL